MFTSRVHCLNLCAQFRRVELGTTIRCRVVFGIGEEGDGLEGFAEALCGGRGEVMWRWENISIETLKLVSLISAHSKSLRSPPEPSSPLGEYIFSFSRPDFDAND